MFEYFKNKRIKNARRLQAKKTREEQRRQIEIKEDNRIIIDVPKDHVRRVLKALDRYIDQKEHKNENKFILWRECEIALPDLKGTQSDWFINVKGSDVIEIKECFTSPGTMNTDYVDTWWPQELKKY